MLESIGNVYPISCQESNNKIYPTLLNCLSISLSPLSLFRATRHDVAEAFIGVPVEFTGRHEIL